MLETVWPYIQDLYQIIQKRKLHAAPGLDGWRTAELQQLTAAELQPCADFFDFIVCSDQPLPTSLVCAKQVILNKPGPATPLNKKLITILPALLIAYTGARFAQLHEWQNTTMPTSILGGIRGRHMSDLFNQLRLDIDDAKLQDETLMASNLIKAKPSTGLFHTLSLLFFLPLAFPRVSSHSLSKSMMDSIGTFLTVGGPLTLQPRLRTVFAKDVRCRSLP